MLQHIWTVPCRLSTVDRQSNNVSLIEVLEELAIPAGPPQQADHKLVPAVFDIVTLWGREEEDHPAFGFGRMSLVSPDGAVLLVNEYAIDLQQHRRFRSVGRILGFPAKQPGRYHLKVDRKVGESADWEQVAMVPIQVEMLPNE